MGTKAVIIGYLVLVQNGCMGFNYTHIPPPSAIWETMEACRFARESNVKMAKAGGVPISDATICVYVK